MVRKPGSGRPRSVRTAANAGHVTELICSQEGQPGTSKSSREIATELGISQTSVVKIARKDLSMKCFKRVAGQVFIY